jgi:hypothetical protein
LLFLAGAGALASGAAAALCPGRTLVGASRVSLLRLCTARGMNSDADACCPGSAARAAATAEDPEKPAGTAWRAGGRDSATEISRPCANCPTNKEQKRKKERKKERKKRKKKEQTSNQQQGRESARRDDEMEVGKSLIE